MPIGCVRKRSSGKDSGNTSNAYFRYIIDINRVEDAFLSFLSIYIYIYIYLFIYLCIIKSYTKYRIQHENKQTMFKNVDKLALQTNTPLNL